MAEQEQEAPGKRRVVYTIPNMEHATARKDLTYKTVEGVEFKMDVYYPARLRSDAQLPAVLLVHGDAPPEYLRGAREWGQYTSWGQLIAASGLIGVAFEHRSSEELSRIHNVAEDIDDLIRYVRDNSESLHINADALCVWTCSAGSPFGLRAALRETSTFVRCIVSYYGFTELKAYYDAITGTSDSSDEFRELERRQFPLTDEDFEEFSAAALLSKRLTEAPPMLIARAGLDYPELNESVDRFVAEAIAKNTTLDFMNHPEGHHAFDILDDNARSYQIIRATLEFMKAHLSTR